MNVILSFNRILLYIAFYSLHCWEFMGLFKGKKNHKPFDTRFSLTWEFINFGMEMYAVSII